MNIFNQYFNFNNSKKIMSLVGMTDEFFCLYISKMLEAKKESILIVTSTLFEANMLLSSLNSYTENAYLFPMDDFLTSEAVAISPDLKITRLETLNQLCKAEPVIVVTHLNGYLRYLPTKQLYMESIIHLVTSKEYKREKIIKELTHTGYTRESIVSKTGEIAIRGFIIDIFPIGETHPVRIEFFGDEIESIRYFDEETQASIEEIKEITIRPNSEIILDKKEDVIINEHKYIKTLSDKVVNLSGYMKSHITIFKNYTQLKSSYLKLTDEMFEYNSQKDKDFKAEYMFKLEDMNEENIIYYNTIDNVDKEGSKKDIESFDIKEIKSFHEDIEVINTFLKDNIYLGKTVLIYLKEYQIKNFIKCLDTEYIMTNENNIYKNKVNIINKSLNKGYIYKDYIILTDKELFNVQINKSKYKTNFKYTSKIKNLKNLEIGDFIVHNIHGIGIYNGIKTLNKGNLVKDYLEILYLGKDKLYIPVEKIDYISKYNGKEGSAPKVTRLGGVEWQKTKLRIKNKVKDIAEKLIALYAIRESQKGFAFTKDNELQIMFENEFHYEPTKDQVIAISQIKQDMESVRPMDRLLCGDVGYGKTEVAFRAMFKAVNDGKQVLYLCPTTILSSQQFENAKIRFQNFPVNIAVLNRFTSIKETKKVIEDLKEGKVDIVFGTHRILSNDIKPKNLGLLIIDEEQRFGVTHKERIKEYKENVDVLTLTATPIPRTLQMSLAGIRSLSLIETPPVNRYPVQTYVIEENDVLIKDAIYKELSRSGQVFLLYNSVERIEAKMNHISQLVPEARVIYAHGQMNKTELENRMLDFINHKYDVLVCTTIIETGIDIPNVNTLIILDADHYGLSQLYQIRGRVGRSDKIAYAYLMYSKNRILTESAIKRLNVIKEFTELGSGFSIATRDLSIRGAGDLLGSEQAGFIDNVGIELYLKILDEEVRRIKGEDIEEDREEEKPLIDVETHIGDEYVEEADLKIEIHKKINTIDTYEKLVEIKSELEDRFGKLSEKVLLYMHEEWFEKLAKKLSVIKVNETRNYVEVIFNPEMTLKINGEKLFIDAYKISNMFRFAQKNKCLVVIIDTIKLEKHYLYYLLELLGKIEILD